MSCKRTRSSKTTPENSIVIDEEVKERFDSIFKHQPMMSKKGFNMKSNDLMVVPMPIRKTINALKWERFCDARSLPNNELVQEFYASLTHKMPLRLSFGRKSFMPISHNSTISMERMLLLYAILTEKSINFGKIILKEIYDCAKKKTGSAYFPSLITSLCLRARVKTQANLKGQYVQGCITISNIEEEESDKEPVEDPEPRAEPEEEPIKLSVEPEYTTPLPTFASTSRKSEL
ncbi:hypothetical protein PVK06_035329 [Gossypium arboreum]|uniref:Putative plant transposon protein domain-containing protein n=1 Tax=Gossypium arboreum TaxID=29729 RepID=A0ABR0NGI7_GOSAR|nr:hypothetical protein PVK06_035329 [Gossypium arboreum]